MEILTMTTTKDRAAFTLSKAVKQQLEDVIPKNQRSQFVEQAIADALLARARQGALRAIDEAPAHPVESESSVDVLRRIREKRDQQIVSRHRP
jgi:hypothetical protein